VKRQFSLQQSHPSSGTGTRKHRAAAQGAREKAPDKQLQDAQEEEKKKMMP